MNEQDTIQNYRWLTKRDALLLFKRLGETQYRDGWTGEWKDIDEELKRIDENNQS